MSLMNYLVDTKLTKPVFMTFLRMKTGLISLIIF